MLFIDIYEPRQIEELLAQTVPITRMALNHSTMGYADYLWLAYDGHRIQVERKQIDEILSGMDQVEEQLQRELSNGVEETILLIERTCAPIPGIKSTTQSYSRPSPGSGLNKLLMKVLKHDDVMVPGHKYNVSYTGLQAWKSQLDKAGITIVETFDWTTTAHTLIALYKNSQKPEHATLRRYIKNHIITTERNPHVLTLMGVKGGGVGEEIAKALIERFGTAHYTLTQSVDALAETVVGEKRFGPVRAKRLLKAFGRNI